MIKFLAITGSALLFAPSLFAADCISMGGTANTRNLSQTEFVVAMTGDFQGGAFAKSLSAKQMKDGWTEYQLEHYFTTEDGSWIKTRDVGRHQKVYENRYYGETRYQVVDAGGDFAGFRGEMRSWGSFDYGTGDGVLRFEGQLCPDEDA